MKGHGEPMRPTQECAKSRKRLLAEVITRDVKPTELLRAFVRYKHVDYYDVTLFNRAYDWMKARGMSEGQSRHAALVVG